MSVTNCAGSELLGGKPEGADGGGGARYGPWTFAQNQKDQGADGGATLFVQARMPAASKGPCPSPKFRTIKERMQMQMQNNSCKTTDKCEPCARASARTAPAPRTAVEVAVEVGVGVVFRSSC